MPTGILAASEAVQERRYAGKRCERPMASQVRRVIDTLCEVIGPHCRTLTVGDVSPPIINKCVDLWDGRDDLSAGTIHKRLCIMSSMGINVKGNWVSAEPVLKWWLTPDNEAALLAHLRQPEEPFENAHLVADYIEFNCYVGLRVEEALRLRWSEVNLCFNNGINESEMTVPGTKTQGAQATLFVPDEAATILVRLHGSIKEGEERVFPLSYKAMQRAWDKCRAFMGCEDDPMATLKALRRTAARYLSVHGMPTEGIQKYLRHDDIETTMEYLRLVGGYTTTEQRKWLTQYR